MERYIALLRGVNVGGKNKISMPMLRAAMEKNGFSNVSTYINSGNIIFSCENGNTAELQEKCRDIILREFGLEIDSAIVSAGELAEAINHAPDWWDRDADSKHNAIFVIAPSKTSDIIADVGEAKPEYEKVGAYGSVIFWSAPISTFSRTRWSKIASTEAYKRITIRNSNTAKKLQELVK